MRKSCAAMFNAESLRSASRSGAMLLASLALLVKALLPSGLMLDADRAQQGLSPIVLCTGHGAISTLADVDHGDVKKHPVQKSDPKGARVCAFAALSAAFAEPLTAPAQVGVLSGFLENPPARRVASHYVALAAPPPPQTGPPSVL